MGRGRYHVLVRHDLLFRPWGMGGKHSDLLRTCVRRVAVRRREPDRARRGVHLPVHARQRDAGAPRAGSIHPRRRVRIGAYRSARHRGDRGHGPRNVRQPVRLLVLRRARVQPREHRHAQLVVQADAAVVERENQPAHSVQQLYGPGDGRSLGRRWAWRGDAALCRTATHFSWYWSANVYDIVEGDEGKDRIGDEQLPSEYALFPIYDNEDVDALGTEMRPPSQNPGKDAERNRLRPNHISEMLNPLGLACSKM